MVRGLANRVSEFTEKVEQKYVGTLAQVIALVAYGNDYLRNGNTAPDLISFNRTFQFCSKVDFRIAKRQFLFTKIRERIITGNPTKWFEYLKANGCKLMRLYYENSKDQSFAKDHKLAGLVGGGGRWLVEVIYDNYSCYWEGIWTVTNQAAADKKFWTVRYCSLAERQRISNLHIDNKEIKEQLCQTLNEITDFAEKQNLQYWSEQFRKAATALGSNSPEKYYYHNDLIPLNNYLTLARQILFSAGLAWVFGGMGSWNDLGFETKEDNDIYNRLSEQLYSNIIKAIIAGINTF